jgi:hypothetical protein
VEFALEPREVERLTPTVFKAASSTKVIKERWLLQPWV